MAKLILVVVLGLLAITNTAYAGCNDCVSTNHAACINATAYKICFGTTISDYIGVCDPGTVCTDAAGLCLSEVDNSPVCPDPEECKSCGTSPFACISRTEFVLCSADGEPGNMPISCGENKVCNIASYLATTGICTDSCSSKPTCPDEETTTSDPTTQYTKSCTDGLPTGLHPNKSDTSCKTYVFCEKLDGNMFSIMYECPASTPYFDKGTKKCVAVRPSYCSAS